MFSSDLYCKGAKVWIPDPEMVWIGGTIESIVHDHHVFKVKKDTGEVIEVPWSFGNNNTSENNLPFLRNPIILIGQKDLTSLSYLNEPEVLYNLQVRFLERREIYTYCGIVLVAINPYQELPIYGNCIVDAYHSTNFSNLDPHIFAVGENAFRRMSSFNENQSIIVSGESGAGKTVSAKYTMRYFALVGGSKSIQSTTDFNETKIERKVLSSNPIMEAFGNAKTIRNDNSSRFGKYLQIEFNRRNQIISANMRTYLLEKSRVVYQNLGERNYHIFYQLVGHSQSGDDLLINTGLLNNADNYEYLNSGETLEIDGVDDEKEFLNTKNSLLQLGFNKSELRTVCEILAALLHFGNVSFVPSDGDDGCEIQNAEFLRLACHLLGCSWDQMEIWLRFRSINTLHESLHKPLSPEEAKYFRDALVKSIYSNLFTWIVKKINQSFCNESASVKSKGSKKEQCDIRKFIGVLDIYGFETFDENSFEQFCINFANEKLQQQFNLHVFKLEQEEYVKEGLEWTIIDYYNNQPCIDLIEARLGLFDLLDEECKMLKGSDNNWCCKIYSQHLNKSKHFSKPKMSSTAFIVHHFAGHVQYECTGFIDKNRDTILEEQINLLKASDVPIVVELYTHEYLLEPQYLEGASSCKVKSSRLSKLTPSSQSDKCRQMKRSVAYQFRNSLKQLMETLNDTNPHYVRCIKPNDLKLPFTFCAERAVQQLRACGVLETIRLSAAGYPSRWAYDDFYPRYRLLLSRRNLQNLNITNACQHIVKTVIKDEDGFRFGYKKLFFRPGHVAYLEKLRGDKINESVTLIQKMVRGWLAYMKYRRMHSMVIKVQSLMRRKMAQESAQKIRRQRAVTKIQAMSRMYFDRCKYKRMRRSATIIQRWWRAVKHVRVELAHRMQSQIILCQACVRTFLCRKRYLKIIRAFILIQSHFRRRKAGVELRRLKVEARSVNHIKLINKGLENKIIELTQRLDEKEKDIYVITNQNEKSRRLDLEVQKQMKLDATKAHQTIVHDLQNDIVQLKKELSKEIVEKRILYMEKESLDNRYKKKIINLEELIENLTAHIADVEKEIICRDEEIENLKKNSYSIYNVDSKEQLVKEQLDHQTLIKEYSILDMKYQNLYQEFTFVKSRSLRTKENQVNMDSNESSASESISANDDDEMCKASGDESKDVTCDSSGSTGEMALIMQLQMRVSGYSQENNFLRERIQELENKLMESAYCVENQSNGKTSQEKMNLELYGLMKEIKELDNNGMLTILIDQVGDLKRQLLQKVNECQRLKMNMFSGRLGKLGDAINVGFEDPFSEEEEFKLAFESQKDANRKMLKEIDELRNQGSVCRKEMSQLKRDKEHLQIQMSKLGDLIGQQMIIERGIEYILKCQNLKLTPKERVDKFVQNEFSRILSENMHLRESTDKAIAETIQLKRAVKYFALRLQKYEGPVTPHGDRTEDLLKVVEDVISKSRIKSDVSKDFHAKTCMIDLNLSELPNFTKTYIYDMDPSLSLKFETFHVPVYVIFMIAKKYDSFKEEDNIIKFLTKVIKSLKNVTRKHNGDMDFLAMWISNILCLLNLFRQFNGNGSSNASRSHIETKLRFISFDLSQFIRLLEDLCISTFQSIICYIESTLVPRSLCIDAILLFEGIKTPASKDCINDPSYLETTPTNTSFHVLMNHFQSINDVLTNHKVPTGIVNQVFFHITYHINAVCLNHLLFRANLCYFSKGLQIKFNLSNIENWLRNQSLGDCSSIQCLRPMIEAVQVLQTPLKSEDDAQLICNMCPSLNCAQIVKLLRNLSPGDAWSYPLPKGLIEKTEEMLLIQGRGGEVESSTTVPVPIVLPWIVNNQALYDVVIPRSMYLPCMKILTDDQDPSLSR